MAAARDGSLQLGFGLGKYTNRNVFDGYAGVSRGKEQWTVRASRRLSDAPEHLGAGPIHYDVLEPYRLVRFRCDGQRRRTDRVRVDLRGDRAGEARTARHPTLAPRYRLDAEVLRYHQIGVASGWVEVDGVRTDYRTRHLVLDARPLVGGAAGRRHPARPISKRAAGPADLSFRFSWSPMLLERADGSVLRDPPPAPARSACSGYEEQQFEGGIEHADGRVEPFTAVRPDLQFDPVNRRVLGGTLHFTMADGTARPITVEAIGDTGFHLGAGLYFGFDGHHHGEWRGALHVDGEHIDDCTTPDGGAAIAPDPRRGAPRRRPGRRRPGMVQLPDHDLRRVARSGPRRIDVVRLSRWNATRIAVIRFGRARATPRSPWNRSQTTPRRWQRGWRSNDSNDRSGTALRRRRAPAPRRSPAAGAWLR